MQWLFPLLCGAGLFWCLFRTAPDKKTRWVCGILLFVGTFCFVLYSYGVLGVGPASFLLDLFGKAGYIT